MKVNIIWDLAKRACEILCDVKSTPHLFEKEFLMKQPSNKMTAELVKKIKELLGSRLYHQHQIAAILKVNQGRISEVKNGRWDWLLNIKDRQQSLI